MKKKYIFCIPSSTDFAIATAVLIYSIKKNLKLAGMCDFVVPYNDLSERAMNYIRKAHSDVKFEKPKDNSFYSKINTTIYGKDNYDCYLSFEAFWQDGYEKCIYLDADMLCIKDFSEIILDNNGGVTWKYPNLGTVVIGKNHLDKKTYYKLIDQALKRNRNNPGGDQETVKQLFPSNSSSVQIINAFYNFQHWGGGGRGTNKYFKDNQDNIRIIHYSGKRKPWGKCWDSDIYKDNDLNCQRFPHMMWNCEAVKIWYEYFERFKIECVNCNSLSPLEKYQKNKDVVIEDVPDELKGLHMGGI